jgi:hypothetical protein
MTELRVDQAINILEYLESNHAQFVASLESLGIEDAEDEASEIERILCEIGGAADCDER